MLYDIGDATAALAPLGGFGEENAGYKGYGYATVVEILSASLTQGTFLKELLGLSKDRKMEPNHLGHFFIAIDISEFTELEKFKETTSEILRQLRASKKAPGQDRIYTAGEKEYITMLERKDKGLPAIEPLQRMIRELMELENLNPADYDFPFLK